MIFLNKKKIHYRLSPQSKFYDSMSAKWRPFIMFNQFSNIRSQYCNTDNFGLRFNDLKTLDQESTIFDQYKNSEKEEGVVIGNSLSFGEGQSSDSNTISNLLSKKTKYNFYNLSGRGFSGFQEIINFILFKNKLKKLKRILIISGLNDSYLPFVNNIFSEYLTPMFGYDNFINSMSKSSRGWKNMLLKFFLNPLIKKDIEFWEKLNLLNWKDEFFKKDFFKRKNPASTDFDTMYKIYDRDIETWSIISKGLNLKIDYILQPVGSWCKKNKTKEEEDIFLEEDNIKQLKKIFDQVNLEKYLQVKEIITKITNKYSINFIDINETLNKNDYSKKWLFSGKFHLTDLGSEVVSDNIIKKVF